MQCRILLKAVVCSVLLLFIAILASAQTPVITRSALSQSNTNSGQVTNVAFAPVVLYDVGYEPYSVAIADFDRDSKPDLIIAEQVGINTLAGRVTVLFGNGNGTFRRSIHRRSGGWMAQSLAVGDVNGDGKLDVLVAHRCVAERKCSNGVVGVLLGDGFGGFASLNTYSSGGARANWIAIADVNGDGHADAVVADECGDTYCNHGAVGVLLGNGDGTFQPPVIYDSGAWGARSIAIADVNGDYHPDVFVTTCSGTHGICGVGVLLGIGDGTFQATVLYPSGNASNVRVGDINRDGKLDLVITPNATLAVLLGNGDGTFQPPVSYDAGLVALSVAMGDFDVDGNPDLAVIGFPSQSTYGYADLAVLLSNGDGTFQPPTNYNLGGGMGARSVAVGDLDADGKPDLVVAIGGKDWLSEFGVLGVLLNTNNPAPDMLPPSISVTVTPKILSPANGQMVTVRVWGRIVDLGSGLTATSLQYAVKDEYQLVQPTGQFAVDATGNYQFTLLLPASRNGGDRDGRHYIIRVNARDNAGNLGANWGSVVVP